MLPVPYHNRTALHFYISRLKSWRRLLLVPLWKKVTVSSLLILFLDLNATTLVTKLTSRSCSAKTLTELTFITTGTSMKSCTSTRGQVLSFKEKKVFQIMKNASPTFLTTKSSRFQEPTIAARLELILASVTAPTVRTMPFWEMIVPSVWTFHPANATKSCVSTPMTNAKNLQSLVKFLLECLQVLLSLQFIRLWQSFALHPLCCSLIT